MIFMMIYIQFGIAFLLLLPLGIMDLYAHSEYSDDRQGYNSSRMYILMTTLNGFAKTIPNKLRNIYFINLLLTVIYMFVNIFIMMK